ncbi:MAG TPA: ABC transporter permease [Solirubrobacteraceae bacterium]|jgi:ABC-2 type transport system permease protein|nr:ABC transporter permease [Solirubrobacteraceae bacterium]
MSAIAPAAPAATVSPPLGGEDAIWNALRAELQKLGAQLISRLLVIVCVAGPFAFAAVLKVQSGTPSDALFGVWVHSSGFAVSLVILGFAGSWGLPLIAGLLGGDLFSCEDRHGTWKTILTRSCTRTDLYAAKLLAAGALTVALTLLLALSSLVAGILFMGAHSLVDLSGVPAHPGELLALTLLSWILCLLPTLAYTSVAILFSVATRNGIVGVLGPLLVALLTQLLDLIGKGVVVHLLLIGSAFEGWHGLFTTHPFYGPLVVSSLVSVAWIAACIAASWRILRRRDFLGSAVSRGADWRTPIRVVAVAAAVVAVLALLADVGPTGDTDHRLSAAIGEEFNNVTLLQQQLIGRQAPAGAKLDILPNCNRRATKAVGPGDWTCNLNVYLPQAQSVPFSATSVEYDVSVEYDGCYKAESPPAFIGGPTMLAAHGKTVTNPLYIVYGCFNTL